MLEISGYGMQLSEALYLDNAVWGNCGMQLLCQKGATHFEKP